MLDRPAFDAEPSPGPTANQVAHACVFDDDLDVVAARSDRHQRRMIPVRFRIGPSGSIGSHDKSAQPAAEVDAGPDGVGGGGRESNPPDEDRSSQPL
jgi:hypothetical protein